MLTTGTSVLKRKKTPVKPPGTNFISNSCPGRAEQDFHTSFQSLILYSAFIQFASTGNTLCKTVTTWFTICQQRSRASCCCNYIISLATPQPCEAGTDISLYRKSETRGHLSNGPADPVLNFTQIVLCTFTSFSAPCFICLWKRQLQLFHFRFPKCQNHPLVSLFCCWRECRLFPILLSQQYCNEHHCIAVLYASPLSQEVVLWFTQEQIYEVTENTQASAQQSSQFLLPEQRVPRSPHAHIKNLPPHSKGHRSNASTSLTGRIHFVNNTTLPECAGLQYRNLKFRYWQRPGSGH